MAVHTVIGSLVLAMTLHAISHRDPHFLKQTIPLRYLAVARLALRSYLQMRLMAKENEARKLIHALPRHRPIGSVKFRQLRDLGRIFLHTLMTGHAFGRHRNAHRLTGVFVFMAILTLQAHR